jgi:glycosyltransferase involved in cell wall biosynthesis
MTEPQITILQVLPKMESGGVERGTIEMTDAIHKAGWKALVASAGGQLLPHINHARGEHITLPLNTKNPFRIWRNARKLAKLIRARNVNLVHARSRAPAWTAYLAAKWTGVPYIATFHGVYGTQSAFKRRYNRVMTMGRRVIAISHFVMEHIEQTYRTDPAKIRLIPRGVDFNVFGEDHIIPERLAKLTKSWRLPEDDVPVIFCPGRISRIKGQHILIDALAELKDMEFLCILAGKDEGHEEYRMDLEEQIVKLGLEGKVRLADPTNYMNEAYQLSQLVVVPSIKPEAFGRVAIEAQAMGRVVIATDHGGARETVVPNETGYLVPPSNAKAMAVAIKFALERDAATVKAMANYAKQHVRALFSSDIMKSKTLAVYAEVLNEHAALTLQDETSATSTEVPTDEQAA